MAMGDAHRTGICTRHCATHAALGYTHFVNAAARWVANRRGSRQGVQNVPAAYKSTYLDGASQP